MPLDRFPPDPRSVLHFLLYGRELQVQGGKLISNQCLDQSSPPSWFLISAIDERESQMMIIDHVIDWLFSSVLFGLESLSVLTLFFFLSSTFISLSPENDLEVQTGGRGHLQNEREA